MAKTNIDYLREQLDSKDLDHEWLDAVEEEITDLKDEVSSVRDDGTSKDSEISELEDRITELESEQDAIIKLPLGTIYYRVEGSLQLSEQVKDALSAIAKGHVKGMEV